MTTREQVAIRDIPAHCECAWRYLTCPARFVRVGTHPGCPWHKSAAA